MKYLAESLGTFFLVAVVVGSGIMAENLANGNNAVALLGNTIATGAILFVLIKMFGSISGAHFNPAVSLVFYLRKELNKKDLLNYIIVQVISGRSAETNASTGPSPSPAIVTASPSTASWAVTFVRPLPSFAAV